MIVRFTKDVEFERDGKKKRFSRGQVFSTSDPDLTKLVKKWLKDGACFDPSKEPKKEAKARIEEQKED